MKYTAPAMRENGGGSIVNIGSILGKAAAARRPLTTARKAGCVPRRKLQIRRRPVQALGHGGQSVVGADVRALTPTEVEPGGDVIAVISLLMRIKGLDIHPLGIE